MTETQSKVFAFVREFIAVRGYSPSCVEIGRVISRNQSTVCRAMKKLEERGYLKKDGGWRSIEILKAA